MVENENELEYTVYLHLGQVQNLWGQVCSLLQQKLGESVFNTWIMPLAVVSYDGHKLILVVASPSVQQRVTTEYYDLIISLCTQIFPHFHSLDITCNHQPQTAVKQTVRLDPFEEPPLALADDYTSLLDVRFTFENFVMGKPNELAYAAALRIAESELPPFNPLFLYGGVGLGKTHLMHAIAWHIQKTFPQKRVIYMSGEKFMYEFVKALRFKTTVAFKERFRNVDILMIDDVQFIGGKDSTQEEFFHTFNALVDNNHQIIVSADKSPSDLEDMEERLRSRLGWGLVADIHPTNYELRLGILQSKVEALKINVPREVLEFLAVRIISNIRELEGALNRIIAHSTLIGRRIDLDTTQDVLRDLLRSNDRRIITVEDIQEKVCDYYNVKMTDLVSARRLQAIAKPRQVAMYLAKVMTSKSLPSIGRKFGGRDHTTVMHSVKKVEDMMASNRDFSHDIEVLKRSLQS